MPSAPCASPLSKASIVFSGARALPPRCANTSGRDDVKNGCRTTSESIMPALVVTRRSLRQVAAGVGRRAIVAACACALLSAQESNFQDGVLLRDAKAKDLFAAARIAIFGGPGGIARLHSMRLRGRSRFPAADATMLSGTVEIRVLLPDRYLRIDTGSFGRRMTGYAGNTTLDLVETADGNTVANPGDPASIMHADRAVLTTVYADRRATGGMKAPFSIVTTAGDRIVDELLFDEIAVNPSLSKTDFSR